MSEEDIQVVSEALGSNFLTQGPKVEEFEEALARKVGAKQAVAVNSATSALHLACSALEVTADDEVWTSPNSFVASANCARLCGAHIDFVDIDPQTLCLDVKKLAAKLDHCQNIGKALPKVVIPVHFAGHSCEMPEIRRLSQIYGFKIIEDASHALGTITTEDKDGAPDVIPVGSCAYSDICVFSFHPVKIITTIEGGAALTNNAILASRLRDLRTHGIVRDPSRMTSKEPINPWFYEMQSLGLNYRMNDIQATLGLNQLFRLSEFIDKRQKLAGRYQEELSYINARLDSTELDIQCCPTNCSSAFHLFVIHLNSAEARLRCFEALRLESIHPGVHYIPIHTHPYYSSLGFRKGDFPVSESHYERTLSLPIYPGLTQEDFDRVIRTLTKFFLL